MLHKIRHLLRLTKWRIVGNGVLVCPSCQRMAYKTNSGSTGETGISIHAWEVFMRNASYRESLQIKFNKGDRRE